MKQNKKSNNTVSTLGVEAEQKRLERNRRSNEWYYANKEQHLKNVKKWQKEHYADYLKNSYKPLTDKLEARANNQTEFIVYTLVSKIDGRFYIGCHERIKDKEDGYCGSGAVIKQIIKTLGGKKNFRKVFVKKVLCVFDNAKAALEMEDKLIKEAILNPLCLNIQSSSNYHNNGGK